jgi:AraC family transcriptional regulator
LKVSGSYDSAVIGDRFGLRRPPTVLARTASIAPIGFTRLHSDVVGYGRAKDVPPENAFSFHVVLRPVAADIWVDGKHTAVMSALPGATFLFDLSSNPVSEIHTPFDILRIYISQATLDELAFDRGRRRPNRFISCLGTHDKVMHSLAGALLGRVEQPSEQSALFIDHIGLAFHAHVTEVYGESAVAHYAMPGGLAPWQLHRALDFLNAHLDGDPTIAQLAAECRLSAGFFARAFKQSTGMSPHRWLMRKRIERAQDLLLLGRRELAEIAILCGFVDQSHLGRVFAQVVGQSPGRWRRVNCR